ncbi:MAG TPA: chorismate synthase [Clostridia bacterium]|nr:chorismate synthase [Clostridia bacterium]
MIKFSTFGGSHEKIIGGKIFGLPRGFEISVDEISHELFLRKTGIGRSERQNIETDKIHIISGLTKKSVTNGLPLKFIIENIDSKLDEKPPITAVRPSHADLVGSVKYGLNNARMIAEYAGGRSTLAHTVIGNISRQILAAKKIFTYAYSVNIGGVETKTKFDFSLMAKNIGISPVFTIDKEAENKMVEKIEKAKAEGDTMGGIVETGVIGLPMGVGDFHSYSDKLDALISAYLIAIPSVKGIEFGLGKDFASLTGTQVCEQLNCDKGKIYYETNFNGGIIGGMSNGQPLVFRLTVKPVPSTAKKTESIDLITKQKVKSHFERSDTCIVPNVCIIAQNMIATTVLQSILQDKKIAKELGLL